MRAVAATTPKYYWECPACHSRYFSEPFTFSIRDGQLVKVHPICPNCFEKCGAGHEFGYGKRCNICGEPRRRFDLIRFALDPNDPTFGITSTGSTSYPTTTETVGGTGSSDHTSGYATAVKISVTAAGTVKSVGVNWQGTTAGNFRVGIYSHNAGGNKPASLLTESASAAMQAESGWQDSAVAACYLDIGTYWLSLATNAARLFYLNTSGGRRSYYLKSYNAFDATWSDSSSEDAYNPNMRVSYAKIKGYAKATKAILNENASITSASFYSHATGNVRLAIYDDSSGPNALKWESGSVAVSASAWATVNISAGTPDILVLDAGTYWLAWQWDSANSGPSYTAGGANTGAYLAQAYGPFPNPMTGETLSAENWSQYATYLLYIISGITRDSSGDPLGNCTVWLFKSSDKSYQQTTISDADTGAYSFDIADNTTEYFIRAHKDGTPNVFGTTDRDLVGE